MPRDRCRTGRNSGLRGRLGNRAPHRAGPCFQWDPAFPNLCPVFRQGVQILPVKQLVALARNGRGDICQPVVHIVLPCHQASLEQLPCGPIFRHRGERPFGKRNQISLDRHIFGIDGVASAVLSPNYGRAEAEKRMRGLTASVRAERGIFDILQENPDGAQQD